MPDARGYRKSSIQHRESREDFEAQKCDIVNLGVLYLAIFHQDVERVDGLQNRQPCGSLEILIEDEAALIVEIADKRFGAIGV